MKLQCDTEMDDRCYRSPFWCSPRNLAAMKTEAEGELPTRVLWGQTRDEPFHCIPGLRRHLAEPKKVYLN